METETSERFKQVDKRIDDLRSFFSSMGTIAAAVFGTLAIIFAWNLNTEKKELREFRKEVKQEIKIALGQYAAPPKMEMFAYSGEPISGQDIVATIQRDKYGDLYLQFNYVAKNTGGSKSGEISTKIYTKAPLDLGSKSTDESNYKYEAHFSPESNDPSVFPAGLSIGWTTDVYLTNLKPPSPGKYPVLIKIYYGKGKISRFPFNLIIEEYNIEDPPNK